MVAYSRKISQFSPIHRSLPLPQLIIGSTLCSDRRRLVHVDHPITTAALRCRRSRRTSPRRKEGVSSADLCPYHGRTREPTPTDRYCTRGARTEAHGIATSQDIARDAVYSLTEESVASVISAALRNKYSYRLISSFVQLLEILRAKVWRKFNSKRIISENRTDMNMTITREKMPFSDFGSLIIIFLCDFVCFFQVEGLCCKTNNAQFKLKKVYKIHMEILSRLSRSARIENGNFSL